MRKILLISTLLCSIHFSKAQQDQYSTDKRLAGIDTALNRVLKNWQGPGFAVAVVDKNKIIYIKGFGYRDLNAKLPVNTNTLFAIGSCTKAFTASLIGKLAAKDLLNIDKPVREYLPELKFYNDEMNNQITLRDMMSHRTGLPRHDMSWFIFPTTRDSLLQRIQYLEPSAKLRERWQYNNFMFMAQGSVVEKLTHQSWEQNVRDSIFIPLGMNRSDFSVRILEKDSNASYGYELSDTGKTSYSKKMDYYLIGGMGPAGSINSSVSEMSNWLITWINGGKFNGRVIIPSNFVQDATSSQTIIYPGLPEADTKDIQFANYGFGWMLSSYRGHYRVEHGGNIDGFSASTCFFPTDSIGIVVLCNQNNSEIPGIVRNIIADRLFGIKYFDWNSWKFKSYKDNKKSNEEAEKSKVKSADEKPTGFHPLKDYTGLFNNKGYGTFEVYTEHDSLFAKMPAKTHWLKPGTYGWFRPFNRDKYGVVDTTNHGPDMEFRSSANGEVNEVDALMDPSVKPIVFERIPRTANLSVDSLKKYEGDYTISTMTLTIFISGDMLHMTVPGQPEFTLVPIDQNKFSLKGFNGFTILFDEDSNHKITGLQSVQPNGTFKAEKKK